MLQYKDIFESMSKDNPSDPSRREAILAGLGLLAMSALPKVAEASAIQHQKLETREQLGLPNFEKYENPNFTRADHERLHAQIEAEYGFAEDSNLKRWHSDPNRVYVNENAGESIHITGVNEKEGYAEMIWVLAPSYISNGKKVVAHVPFEHEHSNQSEEFEKISGEVTARINGVIVKGKETDFFTAEPEDDHIAWNPGETPLVMRVRYAPAFGKDGELALMVYWGLVNDPFRTKDHGQPRDFALLGALNAHLAPQALASNMPKFLPEMAAPFLVNEFNREKVATLYKELTKEEHPLA